MNPTANLSTSTTVYWSDERGRERECEIEIDYTFDGESIKLGKRNYLGICDSMDDDDLDNQLWEAVEEVCEEAYAEWLADYGEHLRDAAEDRKGDEA